MAPLKVPIHLQDDPDNCGEACAQMVVQFLNQLIANQNAFIPDKKLQLPKWSTSPSQLAGFVNGKLASGQPPYDVLVAPTFDEAMDQIVACVNPPKLASGKPVVVPVRSNRHWVVVFGFTRGSTRAGTAAMSVHVRNPLPDRELLRQTYPKSAPKPAGPHAPADQCPFWDSFGGGGIHGGSPTDEVISWDLWKKQYFLSSPGGGFVFVAPRVPGKALPVVPGIGPSRGGGSTP